MLYTDVEVAAVKISSRMGITRVAASNTYAKTVENVVFWNRNVARPRHKRNRFCLSITNDPVCVA